MKVSVVSKKIIKPCSPTPPNLRKYKISFTDELNPPMNVGFILFYPTSTSIHRSNLEESLAKTLARFYLLAGRYVKEDFCVDCSDEGAEFVEAEAVGISLVDLLSVKDSHHLKDLYPSNYYKLDEAASDPLLSVQVTELKQCGGVVIGFSVPHRIFDACSVTTFISAWSAANCNHPDTINIITPSFDKPSLFPGRNQLLFPDLDSYQPPITDDQGLVCKRFVFNKEAITAMRSRAGAAAAAISRVCVVSAVMAKALIGVDRAKHGKSRSSILSQVVNVRPRTTPPLSPHSCGNLVLDSATRCLSAEETALVGIPELAGLISDSIRKTITTCADLLSSDAPSLILASVSALMQATESGEVNLLLFSDCTKFGFYEADFGWGKPVWACVGPLSHENLALLMRTRDGDGIEAWVHLSRSDMALLEQDQDIKFLARPHSKL